MSHSIHMAMGLALLLAAAEFCGLRGTLLADEIDDGPSPYWLDVRRSCGPFCLAFLEKYYGGSHDYRAVTEPCPPGPEGTTLAELKHAAEQLGYHTLPFKGTAGQLMRLQYPAVLHYQYGQKAAADPRRAIDHFVVLLGWDDAAQKFKIFNPPDTFGMVPYDEIDKHFSGVGLIISNTPLPSLEYVLVPSPLWPILTEIWTGGLLLLVLTWKVWRPRRHRKHNSAGALREAATLLLIATCVLVGCEQPQHDVLTESGSRPESGTQFNAGEVLEGALIKHVFRVVNIGPALSEN